MGFSFLSAIEMVYYCTLRLMCNIHKRRRRKKKRSREIAKEKKEYSANNVDNNHI